MKKTFINLLRLKEQEKFFTLFFLALIILTSLVARIFYLESFPLLKEEAKRGLIALENLKENIPLPQYAFSLALKIPFVFNVSMSSLRYPSLIFETLALFLIFLFSLKIFHNSANKILVSLISAFILAFSFQGFLAGILATEASLILVFFILFLLFILEAVEKPEKLQNFLLAGAFLSLSFYFAPATFLIGALVILTSYLLKNNSKEKLLYGFLWTGAVFVIFSLLALIHLGLKNPSYFKKDIILALQQSFSSIFLVSPLILFFLILSLIRVFYLFYLRKNLNLISGKVILFSLALGSLILPAFGLKESLASSLILIPVAVLSAEGISDTFFALKKSANKTLLFLALFVLLLASAVPTFKKLNYITENNKDFYQLKKSANFLSQNYPAYKKIILYDLERLKDKAQIAKFLVSSKKSKAEALKVEELKKIKEESKNENLLIWILNGSPQALVSALEEFPKAQMESKGILTYLLIKK